MTPAARIDHLVVAAATLEQGIAWCRDTFGFEPASGGAHPLMGTHNRVFRVETPAFPQAYFEIIAIDPNAPAPARRRWFDLDDPRMRETIASGPRLIHFVAASDDAAHAVAALRDQGIDRGALIAAERETPSGMLRWQISVRDDGQPLFDGALPTLIQWGSTHPCTSLPASGVQLRSLEISHPQAARLQRAFEAIGLREVAIHAGPANLIAVLSTPAGLVRLESAGA